MTLRSYRRESKNENMNEVLQGEEGILKTCIFPEEQALYEQQKVSVADTYHKRSEIFVNCTDVVLL